MTECADDTDDDRFVQRAMRLPFAIPSRPVCAARTDSVPSGWQLHVCRNGSRRTAMTKRAEQMPGWQLWVVCEVAVWGLAMGFIQLLFSPLNQVFLFWTRADALLLVASLLAEGTLAWGCALLVRRVAGGRLARLLAPLFFFWLVQAAANWFPNGRQALLPRFPWLSGTVYYLLVWGAGLALSAPAALSDGGRRFSLRAWRVLSYGWMLPLLLSAALILSSPAREPASRAVSSLGPNGEGNGKAPVLMVILDMVAVSEVIEPDGGVAPDLPNLRAFAGVSTYCSETRAPGLQTLESIPGICMQRAVGVPRVAGGKVEWPLKEAPDERVEISGCGDAIPRVVRRAGGRSALCSYYLPWTEWFAGEQAWDAASTRCFYGTGRVDARGWRKWAGRLALVWQQRTEASKTPLAAILKLTDAWNPSTRGYTASMAEDIQAEGAAFLRGSFSRGDFALLHHPLPHPPFVFDEHGRFDPHLASTPASYRGQLRRADALFGEWMAALRDSGLWDEAWVLVTSDHGLHSKGWSRNPEKHEKPRVPLWVKAPGQAEAAVFGQPVQLEALGELPFDIWAFGAGGGGDATEGSDED